MLLDPILSVLKANKGRGLLVLIFMANYRLGHYLYRLRRNGSFWVCPLYLIVIFIGRLLGMVFGCSVPYSCEIGRNVCFQHGLYGVFLSGNARIGDDCVILQQVTIGSSFGSEANAIESPIISNNVFIGVGAKIIGGVYVGEGAKIGANALVMNDVPAGAICVAPLAVVKV